MKRTLIFIAAALLCLAAPAQSYQKLWKAVEQEMEKDLPKSALAQLKKVQEKAVRERNDAQLLKVLFVRYQLQNDVAPDSGLVEMARLEEAYARQTGSIERALWESALGQLYLKDEASHLLYDIRGRLMMRDTARIYRGTVLLRASLANVEQLGKAKAKDYLPLFILGKDSKYYKDDLLHVLSAVAIKEHDVFSQTEKQELRQRMRDFYKAAGRREAALLTTLELIEGGYYDSAPLEKREDYRLLQQTAQEYRKLPLNIETYIAMNDLSPSYSYRKEENTDSLKIALAREGIRLYGKEKRSNELRNYINEMEQPSLEMSSLSNFSYPGDEIKIPVRIRNVQQSELRIYRTPLTARDSYRWDDKKKREAIQGLTPYRTVSREYNGFEAYKWHRDTLHLALNEPGLYVFEMVSGSTDSDVEVMYVTRLRPMTLTGAGDLQRVTPVDAKSGHPLQGGKVTVFNYDSKMETLTQIAAHDAETDGNIFVTTPYSYKNRYWLTLPGDEYCPFFDINHNGGGVERNIKREYNFNIYTDRAIYRPGQTVEFGLVAFSQEGDSLCTDSAMLFHVVLYNSNRQEVETTVLRTDDFGTLHGSFKLPEVCLPGQFFIEAQSHTTRQTKNYYFRVEEYKRPTFTATFSEPEGAYKLGDSITVMGTAQTYTGLPVQGAKVRYTIQRENFYGSNSEKRTGEAVTDSEGHFPVSFRLWSDSTDDDGYWYWYKHFFRYHIEADVTAENGETQQAVYNLSATNRASWLEVEWPNFICKETPPQVCISLRTSGNRNLPARGNYELLRNGQVVAADTFATGVRFTPPALATIGSGTYRLRVQCQELADSSTTFTIISEKDKVPFGTEKLCHYERLSKDGSSAFVMVGTPLQDAILFYDVVSRGKIMESRRIAISDTLIHLQFDYQPAYGDGARLILALARNGQIYTHEVTIKNPLPDKRLKVEWSTFRSLLRPGQQEEWRLRVTKPDGTPATANLMAVLYDASLDQLAMKPWYFSVGFERLISSASWSILRTSSFGLNGSGNTPDYDVPDYVFTTWDRSLFTQHSRLDKLGASAGRRVEPLMERMVSTNYAAPAEAEEMKDDAADTGGDAASGDSHNDVEVRSNFAETAFFHPALRTDKKGEVQLVFTLPESLTSWNFRALAHDQDVCYGQLKSTVIARKDFMIEGNLPRFVREGDHADIPATLRNLSEQTESGTVRCLLLDAETEKTVATFNQRFTLSPNGEQTLHFPFDVTANMPRVLIVRLTAKGRQFSDGEERFLPILADRERVVRTVPFDALTPGQQTLRVDTLWAGTERATDKSLTVELSSNPTWYAVAELPIIANYECYSADAWAVRYYALALADYIGRTTPAIREAAESAGGQHGWADLLKRNPDLKQTLLAETPWAADAENETARLEALAQLFDEERTALRMASALDKMRELQLPDGSWSWFKGMSGSTWITTEVCLLLARQQVLTGNKRAETALSRGFAWLERQMAEEVKAIKKAEKKYKHSFGGSERQLKYLYIRALLKKEADADTKYLLKKFAEYTKSDMYTKAMTAVVQAQYGQQEQASVNIRSLLEHTVEKPGMGRYFDTDRALWCWNSYKMPTQTAAIEALLRVQPDSTKAINAMKLWVMQAKRTQDWSSLRATTDAIYALLVAPGTSGSVKPLDNHEPLYYSLQRGKNILAVNAKSQAQHASTIGYYRQDYTDARTLGADKVVVQKNDEGLSWGAVFAQFTLPSADVLPSGNGLTVKRELEVLREGAWQPISASTVLEKGDRVRQVFTLTADRDYDFVSLKASRAACLEPTEALSGYTYRNGQAFYRVVRDASNEYFFETFRKGTHRFTEESLVDRSGTYTLGLAKIQSQYAPEFCGTTGGILLTVE